MRERVKFITHEGKKILSLDFSNTTPEEFLATIDEARRIIAVQPPDSLRTLTNVQGVRYRRDMSDAIREFVSHNKPYVRAGAVIGLDALKTIMFNFINRVTGRSLRAAEDERAALEYLVNR